MYCHMVPYPIHTVGILACFKVKPKGYPTQGRNEGPWRPGKKLKKRPLNKI